MNLRPRRVEDPEINLVSLIDVVLMMVVFFMLSSSLVDEGRIRIHLPQARDLPAGKPPAEPLVVSVTQQGGYLVNGRELINSSPDTLRAALLKEAGSDRSHARHAARRRAQHASVRDHRHGRAGPAGFRGTEYRHGAPGRGARSRRQMKPAVGLPCVARR